MKNILTFLLALLQVPLFAQTPERQGLKEYCLPDGRDTIRFYIYYSGKTTEKTKVFLYLQGTGAYPMVNNDDSGQCCMSNFPKRLMKQFPEDYAFVYIQKMGLPYYVSSNHFDIPPAFRERNNVADRAGVADRVLSYVLKNIYPEAKIVAVLGHSEGTQVLARLAVKNKRITHICYASGSGYSHLFDEVLLLRHKMNKGLISAAETETAISELYAGADSVRKNKEATDKYFKGDTYKWWYYEMMPPVENLVQLEIPVFLTSGTRDDKVPVEGADYIKSEFERRHKKNLVYKVYQNCDHDYREILENNDIKDHWNELFMDFLHFIDMHPS